MKLEDIAEVCHEVNKAYCEALGDRSQPHWSVAPDWQRESAVKGVRFHIQNPLAGPSASHESWMREKVENGWQFGFIKDPEKKLHPCIVKFEELPRAQQAKDFIFRTIVHSLKGHLS